MASIDPEVTGCEQCAKPTFAGEPLCWEHKKDLLRLVRELRPLLGELDIQVTKQNVAPRQPGGGGKKLEFPILFNVYASQLLDTALADMRKILTQAAVHAPTHSLSRIGKARLYLALVERNPLKVAAVSGAYRFFAKLKADILATIDLPKRKKPVALCPECQRGVFADPEDEEVSCCGRAYRVADEMDKLNAQAREQIVTAHQAEALTRDDEIRLNASTIRSWVRRGHLEPAQQQYAGREMVFRFGDLLDLARKGRSRGEEEE